MALKFLLQLPLVAWVVLSLFKPIMAAFELHELLCWVIAACISAVLFFLYDFGEEVSKE